MKDLLHNGSVDDFAAFWDESVPQKDENGNEVYPSKRSLCSYYDSECRRISGPDTSLEYIDPTTKHEVSNYRVHKAWPAEADSNQTLISLKDNVFKILSVVTDDPTSYEAMQTAYRVTKSVATDGDPGPEGIHQDSAELTVVVLVQRDNVQGGKNRVWSLDQECGKPTEEDIASDRMMKEVVLETPLDTLIVLDREVKHEATAFRPVDESQPAVRDVLTFEVRKHQINER